MRIIVLTAVLCAAMLAGCRTQENQASTWAPESVGIESVGEAATPVPEESSGNNDSIRHGETGSIMENVNFDEFGIVPADVSEPHPIWAYPQAMHIKDGYLIYSSSEYDGNGYAYSLNRADINSGAMLDAVQTHITQIRHAPPAFAPDAIVMLTDETIQRYSYALELLNETPLSRETQEVLERGYMAALSKNGDKLLINDVDGLPTIFDYTTGNAQRIEPLAFPDGFMPVRYDLLEETIKDNIYTFTAMGEDSFPYYRVLYSLNEDRILNYFKVDEFPNGELAPDQIGTDDMYKWFDLTSNTGYVAPGSRGVWLPAGVTRSGLVYRETYGAGPLEIADFSSKKLYRLEMEQSAFNLVADKGIVVCCFSPYQSEQWYMTAFSRG